MSGFDYSSSFAGINNALGNIGKQNEIAYQRQTLANLGKQIQGGDYGGAASAAFAAGDAGVGLGLLKLGQTQKQESDWLKANAGIFGGGVPAVASPGSTAPVAGPASLIQNESGGNWQAQNNAVGSGGAVGHFGRLQFGQARIQDAINSGALPPGTTPQAFMASPELQKRAEAWHFSDIDQKIQQNGFDKLIGQSINGVPITVDGLRAVAHLGGTEGMKKFVESGGRYNPADRNGTRLSDYFARHGGGGAISQPGVQVAENEADVARIESQMPGYGGGQPTQVASNPVTGVDPAQLRAEAQSYAQTNPEAARQLNARADALERAGGGVQAAQADAPAPGAAPAQGFAIPGAAPGASVPSIASDPAVMKLQAALAGAPERFKASIQSRLDIAMKDAERRYNEGKTPEAVREFIWAKRNGLTEAKSPIAYAKEKADATRADTAPVTRQIKQADGSEVVVQWNPDARRWDPLTAPEGGEAVRPKGQKLTEGQSKDLIFHNRGIQALEAFEPVADAYAVGMDRIASQVPGGNYAVPEKFQMAQQAGRNFLASILRKDSGAAITVPEENQYGAIFLPQPGDKPGTLAQKAEARKQAIDAIRNGLGTAEVLALGQRLTTRNPGEAAPPPAAPAPVQAAPAPAPVQRPAGNGPMTITNPNTGQRLMLTPDGKWAPFDG